MIRLRALVARTESRALDLALALALATELVLECWLDSGISHADRLPSSVAAVLLVAPIILRRRWPAAALVAATAVAALQASFGADLGATTGWATLVTMAVLAYSLGHRSGAKSRAAVLALGGALFSIFVFHVARGTLDWAGSDLLLLSVAFVAPWLFGRVVRERGRRVSAFRALAASAAAAHEEAKRSAIAHERDRIRRELEDIIAHTVSAMVIQAGGARQLLRDDPERARDSILTVERTGREALDDLRRLLGMLRKNDDLRTLAPQPGLAELTTLLASLREQALTCQLRSDGERVDLTPGIDLVCYRLIEATLLSAAGHLCRHASVTLNYSHERLELAITGDAAIPDLEQELHEVTTRVALYDGSLRILPATDSGFALHATLPLDTRVPA